MLVQINKLISSIPPIMICEKDATAQITREIIRLGIIRFDKQTPYVKLPTHWQKISRPDLHVVTRNLICPEDRIDISSNTIVEVGKRLSEDISLKLEIEAAFWKQQELINFKNGILNIRTGEFSPERGKHIFDYVLEANYKENVTERDCPHFMRFIATSAGAENKDCILISTGFAISSLTDVKKAIFLIGESDGGKSTYLRLIESAVAPELASSISFQQLADRHYIIQLLGKKLNMSYDNSAKAMDNEQIFKSVVSCERIEGRALRENPVQFIPVAKLFFASNKPYVFKHPDLALYRRMVIIPFEYSIPPEKQDKALLDKLMSERDVISSLAAKSLKAFVMSGYDFRMSPKAKAYLASRIAALHSVEEFLSDRAKIDVNGSVSAAVLFDNYKAWCVDNALDVEDKTEFKENVLGFNPAVDYKKIGPKQKRVWGFKGLSFLFYVSPRVMKCHTMRKIDVFQKVQTKHRNKFFAPVAACVAATFIFV